jgi:hypothetical protein
MLRNPAAAFVCALLMTACGSGDGASAPAPTPPPAPSVKVSGSVDGITQTGNTFVLTGWACAAGTATSINVEVVAGGSPGAGTGTVIGTFPADLASPSSVTSQCDAAGSKYSYSIPLTLSMQSRYGAESIYVYGVPPGGGQGELLNQSGHFAVPQLIWFVPLSSYQSALPSRSCRSITWTCSL